MSGPPKMKVVKTDGKVSVFVTFGTSLEIRRHLETLAATGLYGPSVNHAAERLVARGIEDLIMTGILEREEE